MVVSQGHSQGFSTSLITQSYLCSTSVSTLSLTVGPMGRGRVTVTRRALSFAHRRRESGRILRVLEERGIEVSDQHRKNAEE